MKDQEDFTMMESESIRAFSWLKVESAYLGHYAKQMLNHGK